MRNLYPPSLPQIKERKMAHFGFLQSFIHDLGGWGFAALFYSVKDCSYMYHIRDHIDF